MAVVDFILNTLGIIENVISASIVAILSYMILGGWEYVFRAVSFFFDKHLVKLIGVVYSYFTTLLEGTMFEEALVTELLKNVYVFIGVLMFFRLMMLVIKYLVNPDLIGDAKVGADALVKRVIIGVCGLLFIPTIFNIMMRFQVAVLNDNLIQQIIIPKDMLAEVQEKVSKGGHYIGTYVWSGFMSPNSNASPSEIKQYNLGIEKGDLSNIDVNDGGFLTQRFKYDYFVFISTLALAYVLYLMIKYCIDIAVRYFKLLIYRIISPIAMVEYMINGSQDGVYKNWLSATIATYVSLFVRILAVWFVVFVMALMSGNGNSNYAGNLLKSNDYFLRAIIIIALLGFMMDLPKIIGQIFGVDLEQESSATGVLKQVGGMLKGAAIGGLAVGGAAFGSLTGGLGKGVDARRKAKADAKAMDLSGADLKNQTRKNLKGNLKNMDKGAAFRSGTTGILAAAMASNQFTGAVSNSASQNKRQQESIGENHSAQAQKRSEEKESAADQRRMLSKLVAGQEERKVTERVTRVIESQPAGTSKDTIKMEVERLSFNGHDSEQWASSAGGTAKAMAQTTTPKTRQEVGEIITQSVQQTISASGIKCDNLDPIVQRVIMEAENNGNLDLSLSPVDLAVQVSAIASETMKIAAEPQVQEITQVVNQVYGTRVNNSVDNVTQTVTQKLDQQITIQEEIKRNTEDIKNKP